MTETATTTPAAVKVPWVEPAARFGVQWGSYRARLVLGVAVLGLGYVLCLVIGMTTHDEDLSSYLNDHITPAIAAVFPFVGVVAAAVVLPGYGTARLLYAVIALGGNVFFILPTVRYEQTGLVIEFYSLAVGLLSWAWMVYRERAKALWLFSIAGFLFTLIVFSIASAMFPSASYLQAAFPELFGINPIAPDWVADFWARFTLWILGLLISAGGYFGAVLAARKLQPRFRYYTPAEREARARERHIAMKARQEAATVAQAQVEQAQRVEQIKQWKAAYIQAHDGVAPPPGFVPPIVVQQVAPAQGGTNGFAIAAFIFGLLGGILGIIFGFIALSQIKRTGQRGRGLAIAGIIIAFILIPVGIILQLVL